MRIMKQHLKFPFDVFLCINYIEYMQNVRFEGLSKNLSCHPSLACDIIKNSHIIYIHTTLDEHTTLYEIGDISKSQLE